MTRFKQLARIATAAIFATGVFAGMSGPANATAPSPHRIVTVHPMDTGWGP